jgi:hypothetical protein
LNISSWLWRYWTPCVLPLVLIWPSHLSVNWNISSSSAILPFQGTTGTTYRRRSEILSLVYLWHGQTGNSLEVPYFALYCACISKFISRFAVSWCRKYWLKKTDNEYILLKNFHRKWR